MQRPLQAKPGLRNRVRFSETHLNPTIQKGFIESALLGKPCSRLQHYRLIPVGQAALARAAETRAPHVDSPLSPQADFKPP